MAAAMTLLAAAPMLASNTNDDEHKKVNSLAQRLSEAGACSLEGTLSVSMPQLAEDVIYRITFHQLPSEQPDTLAPVSYVIDWHRDKSENAAEGFSAYFPGNHYRLQGDRLLEYHYATNPVPFGKEKGRGGVQQSAQFANMLPAFLAEELRRMAADDRYYMHVAADTTVNGKKATVLRTIMTIEGVTANEGEYVFDPKSSLPRRIVLENNPGSISEQTVSVEFAEGPELSTTPPTAPLTEEQLIERYPDDFATKRLSSYRLDNLPGRRLPSFEAPTLEGDQAGDRYTFGRDTRLSAPMLIVIAEGDAVFTKDMIAQIRQGVEQVTFPVKVVWAFADSNPYTISEAIGRKGADETVLRGAKGLIRKCGVTDFPSLISVNSKGIVTKAVSGYNNHLASDVINMLTNR